MDVRCAGRTFRARAPPPKALLQAGGPTMARIEEHESASPSLVAKPHSPPNHHMPKIVGGSQTVVDHEGLTIDELAGNVATQNDASLSRTSRWRMPPPSRG